MTFWGLVVEAAEQHPARVLLADEHGRELTTTALRDAAERVAAGLGLTAGDVVSWQLPTTLEAAVLMAACARVGAVQNPIIPLLRDREIRLITAQLGTTKFVTPTTWRGFGHADMARAAGSFEVVALDFEGAPGADLRLPLGDPAALPPPPADDGAFRWAYYTSGTTAAPKGARHTDRSVIASSFGMTDHLGIADGDIYPIAWPLTHIGGATMISSVLRAGGTLVLFDAFDPATIGARMAAFGPTILGSALPFFRAYLDAQRAHGSEPLFPRLRTFVAGGAPTPLEVIKELDEVFGGRVVNSWGLTEFPIAASPAPTDPPDLLATTVGRAAPGVQVRVVDGELRLKGPQAFLGYVDATLDTAAFDDDGWFRTGDLGSVDADGFITISGRGKDVIIRNGENISALEVEEVLMRHPDIRDVAVLGVPDARTGEKVCAVIVPGDREVTLAELAEFCASQGMPKQKAPEHLAVVPAIERNPMGKVVKSQLRERLSLP